MTRAQRGFFRTGAIATLVTGVFHLVGHFSEPQTPPDEKGRLLLELVRTHRMDMMGSERTMWDLMSGFSLAFSLFLFIVGLLGLVLVRRLPEDAATMRIVTGFSALSTGGLLAISVTYWFLAPTVCLAVATLGYAGALVGDRK